MLTTLAVAIVLAAGAGVRLAGAVARPHPRRPRAAGPPIRRWRHAWPSLATMTMPFRRAPVATGELADGIADVARAVGGGTSLSQAISERSLVPDATGRLLAPLAHDMANGRSLVEACDAWPYPPDGDTSLVAASITMVARTGGAAARALDAVSDALRERHHLASEVKAQAAQARLSAKVVAALPAAFTAWAAVVDRRSVSFLVTRPAGLACLAAGLALEGVGAWWMARLVRRVW